MACSSFLRLQDARKTKATSAMSNRDSMNTSIASSNHSVSLWSHRFGWGDSSKLHSAADSQSYNMSDIERLQTIYDETVKKSKKRSKRQFFKSHAQKMRPWSRLSRQGSTASGRSTQTSRSNRGADTTFSESSINSQILPAITLDPNKLNSKYKRSDYSVPKPGQSTDFGKHTRDMRLGNTAQDPSFKELEEKLKKLADISKASLNSERDQPDSKPIKQEQTSPRLAELNPVGSSVSVCVQTSLPDHTIPAANLDTCHSCQQTGRAIVVQKNTTTTGTQMSPQFEIRHHNKDLSYRETEIFQGTGVSTRIESSTNTSGSSSQQLLQRSSQPQGDISSGQMGDSSSLENNKNTSVGGESWNSSLPLQHIEANVVSIKVVGGAPSSEESSIPSSFEKDFKMRKLTSSKNKEKENLVGEGEASIAVGDIEIPALKTKLHSTGPLIRPKEHYRGRRGAITEKFSPKADKQ